MRKFLCILLLIGLASCKGIERDVPPTGEPSDISISIRLPGVQSKAGYDDGNVLPGDDFTSWTDWDFIVDGQKIYRLTLFLVKMPDNVLVGYRDFYENSPDWCDNSDPSHLHGENGFCNSSGVLQPSSTKYSTCAKAYFSYLNPLHGEVEKMSSGNYRLYGVANYAPISGVSTGSGTSTNYTGLEDDGSLYDIIHANTTGIFYQFEHSASGTGLEDFDPAHFPEFFDYKVKAATVGGTEQYVCEQRPQPLTFMTDFLVLSGTKHVEAELVRTYSRIRFVLNNDAETEPLTLNANGFYFDTPLAQKQAYIFDFGDDSKYDPAWCGTPVLSSTHAIHPYNGSAVTVTAGNSSVIFDAYVLESKRGSDKYRYHLDVQYPGASSSAINIYDGKPVRSLSSLQTALNNSCTKFLIIQNDRAHGFYYDNSGSVEYEAYNASRQYLAGKVVVNSDLSLTPVSPETFATIDLDDAALKKFVWSIEKINESLTDWDLYIMNEDTGQYWDKNIVTSDNSERLRTTTVGYRPYMAEEYSGGPGLAFRNKGFSGSGVCYLHKDRYGTTTKNQNTVFALYALDDGLPARADKSILLQVIDPDSQQSYDLEEFRRNDFITVNIAVTIHPDGGWFEFKVIPWVPKSGTVTFD